METLQVKNMVCQRCVLVVEQILSALVLKNAQVELGKINLAKELEAVQKKLLKEQLELVGFELLTNDEEVLIEEIKTSIIEFVSSPKHLNKCNLSDYLKENIGRNYTYLSKLFSAYQGKTIERYFIEIKIEKAKELIKYGKLNTTEISYELGYSSPQHLSRQFKQITGMTTSDFKKNGARMKLDKI